MKYWLYTLALLNALDAITTIIGLRFGAHERNPLMAALIGLGPNYFLAAKGAFSGFAVWQAWKNPKASRSYDVMVKILVCVYAVGVVSNIRVLAKRSVGVNGSTAVPLNRQAGVRSSYGTIHKRVTHK